MAKGFILPREQLSNLVLAPPSLVPRGRVDQTFDSARSFCGALTKNLEKWLSNLPDWQAAGPIVMGSWARFELCPKSDLDVLFVGDEAAAGRVTAHLFEQGIKIRSRVPEDPSDWSKGVELPDLLALFEARALFRQHQPALEEQLNHIFSRAKKKELLKFLAGERESRRERYDSMTNFLEPNLKQGPGGLRDIWQGKIALRLSEHNLDTDGYATKVLDYYREFFLLLRIRLHLSEVSDQLVAGEQMALAQWLKFENHQEFMRALQDGLSRGYFYSQWAVESSLKPIKKMPKLATPTDLLAALKKSCSIQTQFEVRRRSHFIFNDKVSDRARAKLLLNAMTPNASDEFAFSIFQSRIIDHLFPRIRPLMGWSQHDQYHRYTADAHICQTVRNTLRYCKSAKLVHAILPKSAKLKKLDWLILVWTALFHDIAKGTGQDHSELGAEWALSDLKKMGFSKSFATEVSWLVKNHLELSKAAFRKNTHSPMTWKKLFDQGMNPVRLKRLAIFTAIDIQSTNPEAWTKWKIDLLKDFVDFGLRGFAKTWADDLKKIKKPEFLQVISSLDEGLIEKIGLNRIIKDLDRLAKCKDEDILVFKDAKHKIWIRFFHRQDRPGIFSDWLKRIYSIGISVDQALVHTIEGFGVYDWLQVQTNKKPAVIEKWLSKPTEEAALPKVQFSNIDLVDSGEGSAVVSFRGIDQKGILLVATRALSDMGVSIKSAKIHTWGRQFEDTFELENVGVAEDLVQALRTRFID